MGHRDSIECLGQGTNLINFDKHCIGRSTRDSFAQSLRISDEEVIADELNAVTKKHRHIFPTTPIILSEWVFYGNERIAIDESLVILNHLAGASLFAFEFVTAIAEEFGCGNI